MNQDFHTNEQPNTLAQQWAWMDAQFRFADGAGTLNHLILISTCWRKRYAKPFPLPFDGKHPPPKHATGATKHADNDPVWRRWAHDADSQLTNGGNVGLVLSPGLIVADIDTKRLSHDEWRTVAGEIADVLGGYTCFNTTTPDTQRFHGHYLFACDEHAVTGDGFDSKLTVNGVVVGDVIRPNHRYIATGAGYAVNLDGVWVPPPAPEMVLRWAQGGRPVTRAVGGCRTPRGDGYDTARQHAQRQHQRIAQRARQRGHTPSLGTVRLPQTPINAGGRNDTLTALAGRIMRYDETGAGIDLLHTHNQRWCQPPLPNKEIETIWRSVSRYH